MTNGRLLVYAPLRAEAACLDSSVRRRSRVIRSGMGPDRSRIAAARGLAVDAAGVAIVGVCAAAACLEDETCSASLRPWSECLESGRTLGWRLAPGI